MAAACCDATTQTRFWTWKVPSMHICIYNINAIHCRPGLVHKPILPLTRFSSDMPYPPCGLHTVCMPYTDKKLYYQASLFLDSDSRVAKQGCSV